MVEPISFNVLTFLDDVIVTITSTTEGGTIYYTLDGSTPNKNSTKYVGSFSVDRSLTIKAIVTKDGILDSDIASVTVFVSALPTPYLIMSSGTAVDNCKILIDNLEDYLSYEDIVFRYTLDDSEPTENSLTTTGEISLNTNCIVRVKAFGSNGDSSLISSIEVNSLKVQTPILQEKMFAPELSYTLVEGQYIEINIDNESKYKNADFIVSYQDGTSSTTNISDLPIKVYKNGTYAIKAISQDVLDSDTATISVDGLKCADVVFDFDYLSFPCVLTFACATEDIVIHYTTDGSTPTEESSTATIPISFATARTVKAIAKRDGWQDSDITTKEYIEANAPEIIYNDETRILTINADGTAKYILGESSTTFVTYENPINVSSYGYASIINCEIDKVCNFVLYGFVELSLNVSNAQSGGKLVTCTLEALDNIFDSYISQGSIRYTTNGIDPTINDGEMEGSIIINEDCVLKVKYFGTSFEMNGFNAMTSDSIVKEITISLTEILGYNGDTIGYNNDEIGYEV